jgi:hypothetical protein
MKKALSKDESKGERALVAWSKMSDIQRNACIAEKVMGWQWIAYAFYDAAPPDDQLWLLPDGQSVARLTSGEWTYYLEEPEVYPEGSPFPLPHKDNRHLPGWIPDYSTSMDAACTIPAHPSFFGANTEIVCVPKGYWRCCVDFHQRGKEYHGFADTPAEAVCIAFLRAVGVEIETIEV